MIRTIFIGILAAALIGTGWWGMNEKREKEALLVAHENDFQRAFHDLTYHLDQLEDEIGTTLAMNSREQLSSGLANVWRLTSMAQNELGQLPLGLMALNETEQFLHHIGNFSYKHSIRGENKHPLTNEEYEQLRKFYKESGDVKQELRKLQANALKNQLKWTDAEAAMLSGEEPMDNSIVNGFSIMNDKVKGYTETYFTVDDTFSLDVDEKIAKQVKGKPVSKEEAAKIAKKFLDLPDSMKVQVEELDKGVSYDGYSLAIEEPEGEANIYMDMTKNGGHPLWLLQSRPIENVEISLNEASYIAKRFLEKNQFEHMELIDAKQYDTVGAFHFVPVENDVRIYPDAVYVHVALDDGEIIGYKGADYIVHHKKREDLKPEITLEEAKEKVNPHVEIREEHLALILNEDEKEVLCYEFLGTIENDTFQIFINATNGDEEMVKKMESAEPVYDTM